MGKSAKDEHGLTLKERIFADEFILTGNKAASARKAGVKASQTSVYASRMLRNVIVQQYIAPRRKKMATALDDNFGINADRIIRELAAIALFDPRKMYDENGELLPITKMDEMTARAIVGIDVRELTDSDGALVGYVKKVKPASKIAALELLGRNLGMWSEEDSGTLSILNINIVTHENQLDNPSPRVIENETN